MSNQQTRQKWNNTHDAKNNWQYFTTSNDYIRWCNLYNKLVSHEENELQNLFWVWISFETLLVSVVPKYQPTIVESL